ncbi:MAG: NFACT family protein [Ruminiclostridium sp.]
MSLDGAYLHIVREEMLAKKLIGGRVDKVYQPSREEIIITIRTFGGAEKILLSANTSSARACLTSQTLENPKAPPMFCMLMRKHLGGGRLLDISQDGLERILNFDFECTNEIGDLVTNRVAVEIMGKCSNIILLTRKENEWRVVDAVKRVTDDISSVRRILPGILYELPPREERLNLLDCTEEQILSALDLNLPQKLAKAMLKIFEGISPIFARECAFYTARDVDVTIADLTAEHRDRLLFFLKKAKSAMGGQGRFTVVSDLQGKPKDFCFMNIEQYGNEAVVSEYPTANMLLDRFFSGKANAERLKQRSGDLMKLIVNAYERTARKLELQKQELENCKEREVFRVCGDLINANIYRMEKGMNQLVADNFYTGEQQVIKLDVRLTPAQNAQKYYTEYKKLDTAEKMLTTLIKQGEQELVYIDSVFDEASRTTGESELNEIRAELMETGYIRKSKGQGQKPQKALPPLKFRSDDGFEILVGRNNIQNDKLTLKTAKAGDMWLHTQNIPGSHTIILCDGKDVPDNTIVQAATLAAYCSKARESTKVPVDYTRCKFVKKPNGAKPGMVIFTNNKTILVNPDEELYERLKV